MTNGTWIREKDGTRVAGRWVRDAAGKRTLERAEDDGPIQKPTMPPQPKPSPSKRRPNAVEG